MSLQPINIKVYHTESLKHYWKIHPPKQRMNASGRHGCQFGLFKWSNSLQENPRKSHSIGRGEEEWGAEDTLRFLHGQRIFKKFKIQSFCWKMEIGFTDFKAAGGKLK